MHTFVTGVVRCGDQAWKLTVPSELLVLDAASWAKSQKNQYEEDALDAEQDGDFEGASSSREVAQELEMWLRNPEQVVKSVPLLSLRQTVKPFTIYLRHLPEYIAYLVKRHRPAREQPHLSFLLDMQANGCVLYVISRLRAQARHTGPEVLGRVMEQTELQELALSHPVQSSQMRLASFEEFEAYSKQ